MNFTGERYIPGQIDGDIATEHLHRYKSILEFVKGKDVLDAASGEGYGSAIIASVAKHVTAIDIDAEAVALAEEKYRTHNLEYRCASVTEIPLADACVDIVVSFETIEHIDAEMQRRFLSEIKRVLKPEGILIMSTPDKKKYSEEINYKNHYHVKEFYFNEFEAFLNEFFNETEFYLQGIIENKFKSFGLISNNKSDNLRFINNQEFSNEDYQYIIAICSQYKIENLDSIMTIMPQQETDNIVTKLYLNIGNGFNETDKLSIIAQKHEKVLKVNFNLSNVGNFSQMRFDPIEGQPCAIRIHKINTDIDGITVDFINAKLNSHGEYYILDTDPRISILGDFSKATFLEIEYDFRILSLYEMLGETLNSYHTINDLQQIIGDKEAQIKLMRNNEKGYAALKLSRTWRLMMILWRIRDWVIPHNSKRRLFAKLVVKAIKMPSVIFRNLNRTRARKFLYYLKTEGVKGVSRRIDEYLRDTSIKPINLELIDFKEISEISDCEILKFSREERPIVSIVIPVYNQFSFTYNCLRSILKNTHNVSYEIIVADDCSKDLTTKLAEIVENVNIIINDENMHFLKNCNNASKSARGKYILFLNNDTQVQENWLEPLVSLIEEDESVGMVGSKLVYCDGSLQEAGGIVWNDASAWNYGRLSNPNNPEFNYVKEVDYISGASIMISKELWETIGGFDERYVPAYCEDSDLAFEVRKRGYKVMYQPQSVVVHFEGISNGKDVKAGAKAYQVKNQAKFYEKWKLVLEKEHFFNGTNVFAARDRSKDKKCVLVIDHYVPQFDKDAGSRTVFQYLSLLATNGYNVKFIGDNFGKEEPYTGKLEQLGIEVLYGPVYCRNWKQWVNANKEYIHFIFLNRPHISEKYIDFLKENTKAKIIYYGHDLHFLREKREYELVGDKLLLSLSEQWKEKELNIMRKSDVVYYPSQVEKDQISQIDEKINVKVLPAYIFDETQYTDSDFMKRKDIMFIGGFRHRPNVDAIRWFHDMIFPLVLKKRNDIKMYILGSNPPDEIKQLHSDNFIIKGFVTDEELEEFYTKCRLDVVPLRYGAGIKGKVVEAMYYSMPVITTSIGAEGIIGAENILCIKDSPEDFAEAIIELYDNPRQLKEMAMLSTQYINENFSEKNAINVLKEDF